jgi:hypothetical protein
VRDGHEKLTDIVNQSGFPFQLRVEHEVRRNLGLHDWRIRGLEHAWKLQSQGEACGGFIDLIIEKQSSVMIVECKRVLDISWQFIVDPTQTEQLHAVTWINQTDFDFSSWYHGAAEPPSAESIFCVVRGQDKSVSMLERVASELVCATEAFALQEFPLCKELRLGFRHYVPVIVTTASLKIGVISGAEIELSDGKVTAVDWNDVPYLRFRKQLTTHESGKSLDPDLWQRRFDRNQNERSVFVVNADHLSTFLCEYELHYQEINRQFQQFNKPK